MKLRRLLTSMALGISMLVGLAGCEEPTDYTVYGILYTDQTMSVPLANARLDFVASNYETKGYVTTNEEGKFAFFFWNDGNGNAQEVGNIRKSETEDSSSVTLLEPVTITYEGKVLYSGDIEPDQFTTDSPLLLYPGCYNQEGGSGDE